jgi:hypothetical protein
MEAEVLQLGEDDGDPFWAELLVELPHPDSPAGAIKIPATQIKMACTPDRRRLAAFLAPNLINCTARPSRSFLPD